MGAEDYIFVPLHIVKQFLMKRDFFFSNVDYKCDIDFFLQQFSKQVN